MPMLLARFEGPLVGPFLPCCTFLTILYLLHTCAFHLSACDAQRKHVLVQPACFPAPEQRVRTLPAPPARL